MHPCDWSVHGSHSAMNYELSHGHKKDPQTIAWERNWDSACEEPQDPSPGSTLSLVSFLDAYKHHLSEHLHNPYILSNL